MPSFITVGHVEQILGRRRGFSQYKTWPAPILNRDDILFNQLNDISQLSNFKGSKHS